MVNGFTQNSWDRAKEEVLQILQERASQHHSQMISYSALVGALTAIQIEPHDPRLSILLEDIVIYEHINGRPLITVLVVHKTGDQMHGKGFFEISERLGFDVADRERFWIQEFQRTINYWS